MKFTAKTKGKFDKYLAGVQKDTGYMIQCLVETKPNALKAVNLRKMEANLAKHQSGVEKLYLALRNYMSTKSGAITASKSKPIESTMTNVVAALTRMDIVNTMLNKASAEPKGKTAPAKKAKAAPAKKTSKKIDANAKKSLESLKAAKEAERVRRLKAKKTKAAEFDDPDVDVDVTVDEGFDDEVITVEDILNELGVETTDVVETDDVPADDANPYVEDMGAEDNLDETPLAEENDEDDLFSSAMDDEDGDDNLEEDLEGALNELQSKNNSAANKAKAAQLKATAKNNRKFKASGTETSAGLFDFGIKS